MSIVFRALRHGIGDVLAAPLIVAVAMAAMLLIAAPFGMVLGSRLQASLSHQQPVAQGATEIDPEWWQEFVEHAEGLAATFTPAILGFAAPLDNLSSLLDGTHRPLILFVPIAFAVLVWAFIWGGALDRFAHRGDGAGFWRAGLRTVVPFATISAVAGGAIVLLYYTVHPLLFGPVAAMMQPLDERAAFFARVVLYVIFGSLLVTVSLCADYARVLIALSPQLPAVRGLRESWRFVRAHAGAVLSLYLMTGALLVLVLIAYGTLEAYGGSRVGGWRAIAIAQAYIIVRIIIRLAFGASEMRLYRALANN
jgi:hypothetical protein